MFSEKRTLDEFSKLHRAFLFHLGCAAALAWVAALYAACHAPWVSNIRALIDANALSRVESTSSFLFALPILMSIGWASVYFGADVIRRGRVLRSQGAEFAVAGAVSFAVFYMAVERAVSVLLLDFA